MCARYRPVQCNAHLPPVRIRAIILGLKAPPDYPFIMLPGAPQAIRAVAISGVVLLLAGILAAQFLELKGTNEQKLISFLTSRILAVYATVLRRIDNLRNHLFTSGPMATDAVELAYLAGSKSLCSLCALTIWDFLACTRLQGHNKD